MEIECPFCDHEFEVKTWYDGQCPNCGEEYWWDEMCTEDYSDCWATVEWNWKKDK